LVAQDVDLQRRRKTVILGDAPGPFAALDQGFAAKVMIFLFSTGATAFKNIGGLKNPTETGFWRSNSTVGRAWRRWNMAERPQDLK
jgi:hypothetical protein